MAIFSKILKTYDPKDIYVVWSEINIESGFAPNTFLTITPDSERFTTFNGIGGRVARMGNSVQTATISVSLMQNSDANKRLMKKLNSGELGDNSDLAAMTITDTSNTVLVKLEDCYITTLPEFRLGKEYTTVDWTFKARIITGLNVDDSGFGGVGGLIGVL